MDQTFYARSDFDECTVVSHNDNFTFNFVANLQVCIQSIPWVRSQLFQAESDTFLFVVEVKDNHIDLLIQLNDFFRMRNTAPRQVCDMDQTVYATQVDEYTVRSDILNRTFQYLAFFKFGDDVFLLLFEFSFDKSFMRYNNIFEFLVDLHDLEFHCLTYKYIVVADRFYIDLRTRQECFDTEYVNDHTALSTTFNVTFDDFVFFKSFVYTIPRTCSACFLVRQDQLSFFVFLVFDVYFYFVTNFQIRVVTEFCHRYNAI